MWRRYRVALAALLLSLAAHGAVILFAPDIEYLDLRWDEPAGSFFTARLLPPAIHTQSAVVLPPAATMAPRVRAATRLPARARPVQEASSATRATEEMPASPPPVSSANQHDALAAAEVTTPPAAPAAPLPAAEAAPEPPVPEAAPVPAPAPEAAPPAAPPAVKWDGKPVTTLPARIVIAYDLRSSLVDGSARYTWHREDNQYNIDGGIEANGFFATMFVGRLEQQSRGTLTAQGIRPGFFSLKRGENIAESADFKWDEGSIVHHRLQGEHIQPLSEGAQDLVSFIFQFAYVFPEALAAHAPVAFAISNARKMDRYEFRIAGHEKLSLPIGDVDTVHLVRQAKDPADAYEAWLSAAHHYLPVKLRFKLGGRVTVEQIAVSFSSTP
jgi:hypothetical protein